MVGLNLFNSKNQSSTRKTQKEQNYLFPEAGRIQQFKIHRLLLDTELESTTNSIITAANHMKGHIRGTNPLFIIITRLNDENQQNIINGLMELRKYSRKTQTMNNMMLINVSGYNLSIKKRGDKTAAQILQHYENAQLKTLRRLGITAINWDPAEQTITQVLLQQVRQR